MRVLVTGHLGYLGSVLTPLLTSEGHAVVGLDCGLYRGCGFERPRPEVPFLLKDVRDAEAADLEGLDGVVHLAALSNDPLGELDPALTSKVNHQATIRLAELAKAAGVGRFVFASTCSNYGAAGETWVDETAELRPLTPYARSKEEAERDLRRLASDSFSPVLLRCATAYGDSPSMRFDLAVNNLTAWAVATGEVRLKSDGMAWRPLAHVADLARAFAACLVASRDQVHAATLNVGSTAENYRICDVAAMVRDGVLGSRLTFADDAGMDERCYRVNCDRFAARLPEAVPAWTLARGIAELRARFEQEALGPSTFEGPSFSRVDHVRHLIASGAIDQELRWRRAPGIASIPELLRGS